MHIAHMKPGAGGGTSDVVCLRGPFSSLFFSL